MADLRTESGWSRAQRLSTVKAVLRNLAPRFLREYRSILLRLGTRAGWTYIRLRLLDAIGERPSNSGPIPASCRSLLFVCFGNIMRSPMAAALMKQALLQAGLEAQIEVGSAGFHARPGRVAHEWAIEAAKGMGISLGEHRANLLTREMVERADCIFFMDFQNKTELMTLYPEAQNKIYPLSAYAEGRDRYREIVDPYLGNLDSTKSCYRVLETCIRNLMAYSLLPQQTGRVVTSCSSRGVSSAPPR